MELLTLWVSLFVAPDVNRLGAEDWVTRENATGRLRAYGWLARPHLLRLVDPVAGTENPEVRARAFELLDPQERFLFSVRLAWLLTAADPDLEFWTRENRFRVFWGFRRLGLSDEYNGQRAWALNGLWRLNPQWDHLTTVDGKSVPDRVVLCAAALSEARSKMGIVPVAPMPKVKP